jgi:hypothetical protein
MYLDEREQRYVLLLFSSASLTIPIFQDGFVSVARGYIRNKPLHSTARLVSSLERAWR